MPDLFIPSQNKTQNLDHQNDVYENVPKNVPENLPNKVLETVTEKAPKKILGKTVSHTPGMFSALVDHPQKLTFSQQDENEEIILLMRRHFITNLPWVVAVIIALIAPLFITLVSQALDFSIFSFSPGLSIVLIFFYYLLVIGFAFFNFIDWFYNIGIVSNKRLLDLDFERLSHIDLSLTLLPEIEDVVYRQKGFFASLFNYGDVVAHTVTGKEDFVFEKVPRPNQVVEIIARYIADNAH